MEFIAADFVLRRVRDNRYKVRFIHVSHVTDDNGKRRYLLILTHRKLDLLLLDWWLALVKYLVSSLLAVSNFVSMK